MQMIIRKQSDVTQARERNLKILLTVLKYEDDGVISRFSVSCQIKNLHCSYTKF